MMTKRLYILIVGLAMNVVAFAQSSLLPYKNPVLSVDERVKDLLSRMTLEEKVGQLLCPLGWEMYEIKDDEVHPSEKFKRLMKEKNAGMLWATYRADPWTKKTLENGLNPELAAKAGNALQKYVIENTRLGIPLFLAEEAPHGHMAIGTTVFPTGIGMAATWSPVLIEEVGNVIAKEIRSQGAHISYGPVLDLSRDPRWSRVEETFGEDPDYADIVFAVRDEYKDQTESIGQKIMESPAVLSISYTASTMDMVNRMLSTLGIVIIVLIVSAGMLAFVVLYNLNNINITERQRELATLKVLGFFDGEVSQYVLRENIILTIAGILFGAVFGILLHRYIIVTVEVDAVMFGRNIRPISFVYCAVITCIFSAVVNIFMHKKLKKIDMVESLKSVE